MVDILMPVSILLIFYPPCLQWYASNVDSVFVTKGFVLAKRYASYRLYRKSRLYGWCY